MRSPTVKGNTPTQKTVLQAGDVARSCLVRLTPKSLPMNLRSESPIEYRQIETLLLCHAAVRIAERRKRCALVVSSVCASCRKVADVGTAPGKQISRYSRGSCPVFLL